MGREVRRVPPDWKHPEIGRYPNGAIKYQPKRKWSYKEAKADYDEEKAAWERGDFPFYASEENKKMSFEEWSGEAPNPDYYMPEFPEGSCTHFQMYETTSEGTPISPVMATIEELARWLAENNAPAFGSMTATYEQWLATCKRGFSPSCALIDGHIVSGVQLNEEGA